MVESSGVHWQTLMQYIGLNESLQSLLQRYDTLISNKDVLDIFDDPSRQRSVTLDVPKLQAKASSDRPLSPDPFQEFAQQRIRSASQPSVPSLQKADSFNPFDLEEKPKAEKSPADHDKDPFEDLF